MDGDAVRAILDSRRSPQVMEIDGVRVILTPEPDGSWRERRAGADVAPTAVCLFTLTGLVDYVKANRDKLPLDDCVLHVVHQGEVRLLGKLQAPPFHRRHGYAITSFEPMLGKGFSFGAFYDRETFNVALQTLFVDTPERAQVLAVVGNLKEEQVRHAEDDGVTQTVTGRAGIVLGKDVQVPNPVTLRPFRTFREIEQPASKFVLRLQSGKEGELPKCALFEADGGAWKLEAMIAIRSYLTGKFEDAGEKFSVLA